MEFFSPEKNGLLNFKLKRAGSTNSLHRDNANQPIRPPTPTKSILKNKIFFYAFLVVFSFLVFPYVIRNSLFPADAEDLKTNKYFTPNVSAILLLSSSGITLISSWLMVVVTSFGSNNAEILSENSPPGRNKIPRGIVYEYLITVAVISCTIFFDLVLIIRTASQRCSETVLGFIPDWSCNPYATVPTFPMDSAFLVILIPSIFAIIMKEKRVKLTVISWFLSLLGLIIGYTMSESGSSLLIIILYCLLSVIVFTDNMRMQAYTNELYEHLKRSIEQNQQLLDQQKVNQMKDVIGNVSHDLKTPLSSFMQGIDFMLDTLTEFEQKLPPDTLKHDSFHQFFSEMKMHMKNIKNTNAFMLLTINRTIDFTKASKGLKLIPHLDTIDLLETLSLPLNCMKNIQDRIKISLLPIDNQIYNYVVTDKQWLQENVLCLLSNAVKYSTGGEVTVKLSVTTEYEKPPSLTPIQLCSSSSATDTPTVSAMPTENDELTEEKNVHDEERGRRDSSSQNGEKFMLFEIEDNGIGLSKEMIDSLFSPFGQAQKLAGGTGLGLYSLSKRIEALRGKFGVRGRRDGKTGSLFWFTIPYRPDPSVEMMIRSSVIFENLHVHENAFGNKNTTVDDQGFHSLTIKVKEAGHDKKANTHTDVASNNSRRKSSVSWYTAHSASTREDGSLSSHLRVLLIEDSPTITKMTSMLLTKMGFHVSTAENGHIGLNMMMSADEEKKKYDLVLMDFQMPVMDGLEATRRYREYEKGKAGNAVLPFLLTPPRHLHSPSTDSNHHQSVSLSDWNHQRQHHQYHRQIIVGLSATCDKEIIEDAMKMGLDDFLMKPISKDAILKIIKQFHLPYNSTI